MKSALYCLLTPPWMAWLLDWFYEPPFGMDAVADVQTLILQLFIYISLFFTLLTVPIVLSQARSRALRHAHHQC
jgi:hypothetical protein